MFAEIANRAYAAYAADRWAALTVAHVNLMRGCARTALAEYRAALGGLVELMGGESFSWPLVSRDPRTASAAAAIVYLRDFYQLTKTWRSWPLLASPVRAAPAYAALAPSMRGQIEAGWGLSQLGSAPSDMIIAGLERALSDVAGDNSGDGRWARAALHLALATAYNHTLNSVEGERHAKAALSFTDAPAYFAIRGYEELGSAYYDAATMQGDDPVIFNAALAAYDSADEIVARIGADAWPMTRDYDKGWLYNRLGQFERAVEHFERGAFRRMAGGLLYDSGRCLYGMGYAQLRLKKHAAARSSLRRALDLFSDDDAQMNVDALGAGSRSPRMVGVIFQILGLVDEDEGDLQAARANLELSLEHLQTVTNPASHLDTLTPLVRVCRALGDTEIAAVYQTRLDALRERFELPRDGTTSD